jgi:hypothetical protein
MQPPPVVRVIAVISARGKPAGQPICTTHLVAVVKVVPLAQWPQLLARRADVARHDALAQHVGVVLAAYKCHRAGQALGAGGCRGGGAGRQTVRSSQRHCMLIE